MFDILEALPADPILGLISRFREDSRSRKIDLGVGVFRTDEGHTPVLDCVKQAESQLLASELSKTYVGPAGNPDFNQLIAELALGKEHPVIQQNRLALIQTPGGCGALRVAGELIMRAKPGARLWVSNPTWANHIPLLGDAGIEIRSYRYYDSSAHGLDFTGMLSDLEQVEEGDYVLLHACCHNPCGADLNREQWQRVAEFALERKIIPLVDMAYQGFGSNLDDDAWGLRLMAETVPEMLLVVSCSKNFGLYRERVGAVGVVCASSSGVPVVASHIMSIVRGIYSMPPSHGASVVAEILASDELRAVWENELAVMRERIRAMRSGIVSSMRGLGLGQTFDFIEREHGMFSFLGLSEHQVERLINEFGIYMVDSSRINVAGLNAGNLALFSEAVASVIKS